MKKGILLLCLLVAILDCLAARRSRYFGSRIFWDSRLPVTVFERGGYARLIQLQDGRLMACCESGGIKVAYSCDLGNTWSSPQLIAANTNNTPNCVPDLIQLTDGTIIVAYNPRPARPYTSDRRFGIRLRRSADNGATWGEEIFVYDADSTFDNGCWEPSMLELPSGELQLFFADESPFTQNNDQQISVVRSWDEGLTWSAPACVSYRQGYRDGMPVPVLLCDRKTIAVAIEDNGMGYGDFVPVVVRSTTSAGWKHFVRSSDSRRTVAVDYACCPVAKGGAPYLRVLPNGETLLSHQSPLNHDGKPTMHVYVGNRTATQFRAMSTPFHVPQGQSALWNSLAVVDSGVVIAVSGFGGGIHMVKGYPARQISARYASPAVDGVFSPGEGYHAADGRQIMMGCQTGTFAYADVAYDRDSLYLICQVFDECREPNSDAVCFYLDVKSAAHGTPQATSRRYRISASGCLSASKGNGTMWVEQDAPGGRTVVENASQHYVVEVAIPWVELGWKKPSTGEAMWFTLEVTNSDGTGQVTETIPDAFPNRPTTWMPLVLERKK